MDRSEIVNKLRSETKVRCRSVETDSHLSRVDVRRRVSRSLLAAPRRAVDDSLRATGGYDEYRIRDAISGPRNRGILHASRPNLLKRNARSATDTAGSHGRVLGRYLLSSRSFHRCAIERERRDSSDARALLPLNDQMGVPTFLSALPRPAKCRSSMVYRRMGENTWKYL